MAIPLSSLTPELSTKSPPQPSPALQKREDVLVTMLCLAEITSSVAVKQNHVQLVQL